jgi:GNAT superfamily N-acetyltransferase
LSEIIIRPLSDSDSLKALTELLHRAYAPLAEMGLKYVATYQSVETTRERISGGVCFVAEREGRIVGTIKYSPPGRGRGSPWMLRPEVAHISQFGVERTLQRQGIGDLLMDHVEAFARNNGDVELALDTAKPAVHLIRWYRRRGYRFIEEVDWEITNYVSVVMSKRLVEAGPE